ncbi:hypothetical protein Acr_22g0007460 [Actinidia rufa]|uniref:Uncharacterized protein n=1 Tax=Actinidia rufa TaxID=165716 RepID=A0A7J0GKT2_9ERIC|nr:hypothetical protein Acr_22g0007460 [Actinidia rufa]
MMLPSIPSERSALVSVPQSERRSQPTHCDSGPSVGSDDKDKLHCDYCSDLVTLGKPAGVSMVDLLLKDEVVVQDLRVVVVAVLVLYILQWSNLLL